MQPNDFGVDVAALPKLILNEDAGRHMFERMLSIRAFRIGLNLAKEVYFRHYLDHHLDVKAAEFGDETNLNEWKKLIAPLKRDHELVWNSINDVVNRHVFLIVTAWASIESNVLNEDDKEFVNCNAYRQSFSAILNGAIEVDEVAAYVVRGLNKSDLQGVMQGFDRTMDAVGHMESALGRYGNVMKHYVADAIENKDYGKDMPVHKRG